MRTSTKYNKAQQQMWKGETAFRIKKGTALPETQQPQFATKTQPKSTEQKVTPQVIRYNPRTRLREKITGKQQSGPRTAQQIHLRTSTKKQKIQTKHNHRYGKARQPSGSRKAQSCQKRYSNNLQQRHSQGASHRATEEHTTSDSRTRLKEKTTPPTLQESAAPHTTKGAADMDFHILQKYIMEETTGTEKAHTRREHTSSHTQHFTHQSRRMTGQTLSDLHLANRPRYNW